LSNALRKSKEYSSLSRDLAWAPPPLRRRGKANLPIRGSLKSLSSGVKSVASRLVIVRELIAEEFPHEGRLCRFRSARKHKFQEYFNSPDSHLICNSCYLCNKYPDYHHSFEEFEGTLFSIWFLGLNQVMKKAMSIVWDRPNGPCI